MIKEYNKHEQSQQKSTSYNSTFVKDSLQFVLEYFTAKEQLVIGALMTYKDCAAIFPSQKTLALKAHVSPRTVWSTIHKLKKYQLITVKQRINKSLIYSFAKKLLQVARPFMGSLYLSIRLLLSSSQSQNSNICELIRNKDVLRIIKEEYEHSESMVERGVMVHASSIDYHRATSNVQKMIKKEEDMGERVIVREINKFFTLTDRQLFLLDQYSDAQIERVLKQMHRKGKLDSPSGYFFAALQGIRNKERQRPISDISSFPYENKSTLGQSGSYTKPQEFHKKGNSVINTSQQSVSTPYTVQPQGAYLSHNVTIDDMKHELNDIIQRIIKLGDAANYFSDILLQNFKKRALYLHEQIKLMKD